MKEAINLFNYSALVTTLNFEKIRIIEIWGVLLFQDTFVADHSPTAKKQKTWDGFFAIPKPPDWCGSDRY